MLSLMDIDVLKKLESDTSKAIAGVNAAGGGGYFAELLRVEYLAELHAIQAELARRKSATTDTSYDHIT